MSELKFIPSLRQGPVSDEIDDAHVLERSLHLRRQATQSPSSSDHLTHFFRTVQYWDWRDDWQHCAIQTRHFARLSAYQLTVEVAEHSLKRDLIVYLGTNRGELDEIHTELRFHRQLFGHIFGVLGAEPVLSIAPQPPAKLTEELAAALLQRLTQFAKTPSTKHPDETEFEGAASTVARLARDVLGAETSTSHRWKRDREDHEAELVVEVRYPVTTSKAALRQFLERYADEIPAEVQQRITVIRLPSE